MVYMDVLLKGMDILLENMYISNSSPQIYLIEMFCHHY